MLMPVIEDVRAKAGLTQQDIGFTCSGSTDYLAGQAFSFVLTLDGVGPWPPIQESHVEMDGAWALYEAWVKLQLGERRHRPRLLLRQVVAGTDPRGADPPARPVLRRPRCGPTPISLAALQARAAARRRQGHRGGHRRGRRPQPPQRPATTRTPSWRGTARSRSTSPTTADRRPAAQGRLPADHRRRVRGRSSPPTTWPASCASGRRGSGASTTASSRWPSACATSPTRRRPRTPARRPASATARSTSPSCTRRSATRS